MTNVQSVEQGPVQSVQESDNDSGIDEELIMLQAHRNRMFNKGHTIEEVDMQFMQTNKFYIKKILKGDVKTKVLDDAEVYKGF